MTYLALTLRIGTPLILKGPVTSRTPCSRFLSRTTRLPRKRPASRIRTVPGWRVSRGDQARIALRIYVEGTAVSLNVLYFVLRLLMSHVAACLSLSSLDAAEADISVAWGSSVNSVLSSIRLKSTLSHPNSPSSTGVLFEILLFTLSIFVAGGDGPCRISWLELYAPCCESRRDMLHCVRHRRDWLNLRSWAWSHRRQGTTSGPCRSGEGPPGSTFRTSSVGSAATL